MNRKGFTLVELIATIVVLALVVSITTFSITTIIKKSKAKLYDELITDVTEASEQYYIECKYGETDAINCSNTVTLGDLVNYGYLKGNSTDDSDKYTLVDPRNSKNIGMCSITITNENGVIIVTPNDNLADCPREYKVGKALGSSSGGLGSNGETVNPSASDDDIVIQHPSSIDDGVNLGSNSSSADADLPIVPRPSQEVR